MNSQAIGIEQRVQLLKRCRVFADAPANELGLLAEMMAVESYRQDEVLFESGDPADRIYVLVSGELAVFIATSDREHDIIRPGELLGEYGMFVGQCRSATVRAKMDSVLLALDYTRFRRFLLLCPESLLVMLEVAVKRLVQLRTPDLFKAGDPQQ